MVLKVKRQQFYFILLSHFSFLFHLFLSLTRGYIRLLRLDPIIARSIICRGLPRNLPQGWFPLLLREGGGGRVFRLPAEVENDCLKLFDSDNISKRGTPYSGAKEVETTNQILDRSIVA